MAIRSLCLIVSTTAALLGGCGGGESDDTPEPLGDGRQAAADSAGALTPEPLRPLSLSSEPIGIGDLAGAAAQANGPEPLQRAAVPCGDGSCPL